MRCEDGRRRKGERPLYGSGTDISKSLGADTAVVRVWSVVDDDVRATRKAFVEEKVALTLSSWSFANRQANPGSGPGAPKKPKQGCCQSTGHRGSLGPSCGARCLWLALRSSPDLGAEFRCQRRQAKQIPKPPKNLMEQTCYRRVVQEHTRMLSPGSDRLATQLDTRYLYNAFKLFTFPLCLMVSDTSTG